MSSNTEKFELYMKDPSTDGDDTFDIEAMMNDNWKKIDRNAFREQFGIKSLNYDSTNDRIEVIVGPGIAELFDSNEANLLVKKDLETTYYINAPVINTTYYFFIQDDSTFSHNTTGDIPSTAILLWEITTGSDLTTLTAFDKRALLSSAGVILANHLSNSENPHQVTSKQINEATAVDASVSGTEYPVGLTYFTVSTATGYPNSTGTVFNVKYNNARFTQYFYHHGSDGNTGVWVRHFYTDTWTAFDKLETTAGAQAKADAAQAASMNKASKQIPGADYNNAIEEGWYRGPGADSFNAPPGQLRYGILLVQQRNSSIYQLAYRDGEISSRHYNSSDGTWGEWHIVWTSHEVEYGSNSNGEYVRYPNGVQICWAIVKVNLASGSPSSFVYPASFIETPAASWGVLGGVTTGDFSALWNAYVQAMTAWQFRTDGTGATTDQNIALKAIGRWK